MRSFLFVALFSGLLAACSPAQVQTAQTDQAVVQAVLNAACSNSTLEALVATAVPEVGLGCAGGVAGSAIVTAVLNNPALVARIEALKS